jgi:glycosyltransferase involved in cell wall biosynthesis
MKILYVSDSTTVSGAEIVMLGYIDALHARGHSAHAFVQRANTRLQKEFETREVPVVASDAYSRRIVKSTFNPAELLEFGRSFAAVAREMSAVIRAERIDLIHAISYPASLYVAFASATTGVPQVWHEHNIKRLHPINRAIYRHVSATCKWVIGPSDAVTGNLAKAGIHPARLRTVYNGIDLSKFAVNRDDQARAIRKEFGVGERSAAIGLFGQMLPYKGHLTLIEAAPSILKDHPDTRFFLVGALENPPYEERLHTEIAARGLTERFHFTGWRADVQDIIRAMDVVVVGTTTPEPAALALMESMAMERALVATRTGGTPEIVLDGQTGLLYAPGNAQQLARHIIRLLGEPEFARELGRAGRERVERNFSRGRHIDEMFALYEQIIPLRGK